MLFRFGEGVVGPHRETGNAIDRVDRGDLIVGGDLVVVPNVDVGIVVVPVLEPLAVVDTGTIGRVVGVVVASVDRGHRVEPVELFAPLGRLERRRGVEREIAVVDDRNVVRVSSGVLPRGIGDVVLEMNGLPTLGSRLSRRDVAARKGSRRRRGRGGPDVVHDHHLAAVRGGRLGVEQPEPKERGRQQQSAKFLH